VSEVPSEHTVERIRKMLAPADGRANENESATAAAMAARLMSRYNLDRAAVMGESLAELDIAASNHSAMDDSDTVSGAGARNRSPYVGWSLTAAVVIVIGFMLARGITPTVTDHKMEEAVAQLLGQLDGTSSGAMRAIRAHDAASNSPRPSDEEMARLMAATNKKLPVRVDEVTWVKNVRATREAIVYEFEIRDRFVADAMRQLGSEELKLVISQSAAEIGADVCAPIRQSNRHFVIRSDYVDVYSAPINSFSYGLGECLDSR
jgi:hypothetical protein